MAIAFDAESNSGATYWNNIVSSSTLSHTCTGSNLLLLVPVYTYNAAGSGTITTSSVTYNSVSMTQVAHISGTADGVQQDVSLWYLNTPATGAHTISATYSGSVQYSSLHGMSYTGCDQTSAVIDSFNTGQSGSTGSAAATSLTLSTTVVHSNCWTVGFAAARGSDPAAGTGTTLRAHNSSSFASGGDSNAIVSTGSQSLQWTSTSGAWPGGIIVSISPPITSSSKFGTSRLLVGVGT